MDTNKRPNQRMMDSSIEAWRKIIKTSKYESEKEKVYETLKHYDVPMTRQMISHYSGIPINHITEYVKRLLEADRIIQSKNKIMCQVSPNKAYYLKLNEL